MPSSQRSLLGEYSQEPLQSRVLCASRQLLKSVTNRNAQFVKCNVSIWEDQVALFKAAISNSPHKSCDIVVANAGISGPDPVYQLDSQ